MPTASGVHGAREQDADAGGRRRRTWREPPITEAFWRDIVGGLYCPEYTLVRHGARRGVRRADAVILPDEPTRAASRAEHPPLDGRDVVAVQTKVSRLGMYLLGQAVFTAALCRRLGARSVRSAAVCTAGDEVLLSFLSDYPEVEVWVWDGRGFTRQHAA